MTPRARVRLAAGLAAVSLLLAGALSGWRLSVRFERADRDEVTRPRTETPIGHLRPTALPNVGARLAPALRVGPAPADRRVGVRAAARGALPREMQASRRASAPLPARGAGLHITFAHAWRAQSYEIGPAQPQSLKVWCPGCSRNGGVTLVEWTP